MLPEMKVLERTKEVFRFAERIYGVDMSQVYIRFDLAGSQAGQAGQMDDIFYVRFNRDMIRRAAFEHVHEQSVPHEVSHLVCFMLPFLGKGHDEGWADVCRTLGGNGDPMHDEEVVYSKGATYEYISSTGVKLRVSQQVHARVMQGQCYTFPRGKGTIYDGCSYSIVGIRGKTLIQAIPNPAPGLCVQTDFGVL